MASCRLSPADFRTALSTTLDRKAGEVTASRILGYHLLSDHCMSGPVQVYKINSRNVALFEEYLRIRGEEFLRASSQKQEDPKEVCSIDE